MNSETVSWLLALQIALPFLILSFVLIFMLMNGRKKYKLAARELIEKVKNNEEKQSNELNSFLTEKLSLDEPEAKNQTKKIINERKFLLRNLISALLDKNTEGLVGLDDDLSRLSGHYHNLDLGAKSDDSADSTEEEKVEQNDADTESESDDQAEQPNYQEEIKGYKKEIKNLKHEVHVTLTTLNNIFSEFSSMFGEEVENKEMSVDQIINAMQAFSNKKAAENVEATSESKSEPKEASDETEESTATDDAVEESSISEEPSESLDTKNLESDEEAVDISSDEELDDIDSVLDELELDAYPDDEPSWDDAFDESGDKKAE